MQTFGLCRLNIVLIISIFMICWVEVNSKTNYSLVTSDSSYTDAWLTASTPIKCEYCWLTDSTSWTNDRTICTPVSDRKLQIFFYALCTLAGATILIPVVCYMFYFSLIFRFCGGFYKTGRGVTICELLCRCMWFCWIDFDKKRLGGAIWNKCRKPKSGGEYSGV